MDEIGPFIDDISWYIMIYHDDLWENMARL